MKQVPGLDALFLHLETPEMPMHVGALHLFELPPGFRGRWINALRKHLQSRLPHAPALRRQLAELPLNLVNPVWVDVMPDLRLHVVPHTLEPGAGLAALHAEVARLHVELLPRDRPLWKFHVFEDLTPGDNGRKRVALYTQLHHAAVDGQSAVALAEVLLDLTPEPRELPAPGKRRPKQPQLGTVDQWRLALSEQAKQFIDLAKSLPASAGTLTQVAGTAAGQSLARTAKNVMARLTGGSKVKAEGHSMLNLAPRTRFNVAVSATRSFASLSLPLPALQAARKALGASLNDAVLYLCSTALRELLKDAGELPRKPLIAAVPVSMREAGDASAGNQVTMSSLSLGTHLADPKKRFAHIRAATEHMKGGLAALKSLMPTDFPSIGLPWLLSTAARAWGGVAERIPPVVNLVISNVPGPCVPLYLAGARMLTNAPASIVVHGIALNITVQTYEKHLEVGLIACGEALPDIDVLAAQMRAAYDGFIELAAAD
ncbi:MAG: wax ester/triacylglycerol synthase family O-acyltransferase [Inhella sp.]|jgi:diacylglycerol O-acyltransferase|uniref:wax ester/triacylglycerol synthase family O-acyltransferase n=1 Tax=Inhella sp. TaxID=1921806 RepID=UPI0022C87730|nr:wax ester/triacylglycerol synthase family O-acyltransferase [Inhella sp.]MCZ8235490.1 wax ester/triacylglycerol synthase family O-acyltransferase [Inhella sp.]